MSLAAAAPGPPEAAAPARTVLVVDDDPDIRGLLEAVLRGAGYAVELAADGLEALERLGGGPPALVLLDVMMPRMDGVAFARELGRLGLRPRVPVVMLSAGGRARQARDEVGAEDHLAKPFDLAALLATVARLAA